MTVYVMTGPAGKASWSLLTCWSTGCFLTRVYYGLLDAVHGPGSD